MTRSRTRRWLLLSVAVGLLVAAGAGNAVSPVAADASASACGPASPSDGAGGLTIETFVAPNGSYDRLASPAALRAARTAGWLSPAAGGPDRTWADEIVAHRDVVVHRLSLSGDATTLADRLDADPPATERFAELAARGTINFEYWGPSACPPELALNATVEHGALRVLTDPENDTVALVLDADRLRFDPLDGDEPTTDPRTVLGFHRLRMELPGAGPLAQRTVAAEAGYHVYPAAAELGTRHDGLARFEATAGQRLRGRTTLAPGTELELTLVAYAGADRNVSATTVVGPNRSFAATVDLADAGDRAVYWLLLEPPAGPPVIEGQRTLVSVGGASAARVELHNQTGTGELLYGPALTTTHGGFVVVRNASGGLIGVSEYRAPGRAVAQIDLDPRLRQGQRVTVTVYRDVNRNRQFDDHDAPYHLDGRPVRDVARVEVKVEGSPTTTAPAATTRSVSSPTTTAEVGPESPTSTGLGTEPTSSPGQPGFGPVAAQVGIVVALLLGRRRHGAS